MRKHNQHTYLVVVHSKHPLKEGGRIVPKKMQIVEQVSICNSIKPAVLSSASLIIDIEKRVLTKTRSEYNDVTPAKVIDHYIENYGSQIQQFYKKYYQEEYTAIQAK